MESHPPSRTGIMQLGIPWGHAAFEGAAAPCEAFLAGPVQDRIHRQGTMTERGPIAQPTSADNGIGQLQALQEVRERHRQARTASQNQIGDEEAGRNWRARGNHGLLACQTGEGQHALGRRRTIVQPGSDMQAIGNFQAEQAAGIDTGSLNCENRVSPAFFGSETNMQDRSACGSNDRIRTDRAYSTAELVVPGISPSSSSIDKQSRAAAAASSPVSRIASADDAPVENGDTSTAAANHSSAQSTNEEQHLSQEDAGRIRGDRVAANHQAAASSSTQSTNALQRHARHISVASGQSSRSATSNRPPPCPSNPVPHRNPLLSRHPLLDQQPVRARNSPPPRDRPPPGSPPPPAHGVGGQVPIAMAAPAHIGTSAQGQPAPVGAASMQYQLEEGQGPPAPGGRDGVTRKSLAPAYHRLPVGSQRNGVGGKKPGVTAPEVSSTERSEASLFGLSESLPASLQRSGSPSPSAAAAAAATFQAGGRLNPAERSLPASTSRRSTFRGSVGTSRHSHSPAPPPLAQQPAGAGTSTHFVEPAGEREVRENPGASRPAEHSDGTAADSPQSQAHAQDPVSGASQPACDGITAAEGATTMGASAAEDATASERETAPEDAMASECTTARVPGRDEPGWDGRTLQMPWPSYSGAKFRKAYTLPEHGVDDGKAVMYRTCRDIKPMKTTVLLHQRPLGNLEAPPFRSSVDGHPVCFQDGSKAIVFQYEKAAIDGQADVLAMPFQLEAMPRARFTSAA
ncbi:mucin-1-like isoform X2 [Sycon ciliatum]|uniref:mucin-1-like isoform X2 n=1 Tax=Sycon ciliatum TaxID=27933 RepID=UPI0031F63378